MTLGMWVEKAKEVYIIMKLAILHLSFDHVWISLMNQTELNV